MKKFRYRLEWFLVSLFARVIPLLSLSALRAFADFAGGLVYRFDRRGREVALANLQAAFGEKLNQGERQRLACRSFQIFGRSFLELFWTPRLNRKNLDRYITFENPDTFEDLLSRKQTAIVITIHCGNFEWGSALFAFRGYEAVILTQRFKNDLLTPIFTKVRATSGHEVVTQEKSMIRLLKALKRHRPVGILTDLTLKMNDPGIIIRCFGMMTRTTLIHAVLHQRTQLPIVPFVTLPRADGGYAVRILEPLIFPPGTSHDQVVQTCWDRFETVIQENPEQWLWFYKHWRYLPPSPDRSYPFYANRSPKFDRELQTGMGDSLRPFEKNQDQ